MGLPYRRDLTLCFVLGRGYLVLCVGGGGGEAGEGKPGEMI